MEDYVGEPTEGAWVFVSHSHRDLEKVREIRNYLEGKGRNPLSQSQDA